MLEGDYPSISRTSPARGPFWDSSGVKSTRCPSLSSSKTAPRTELRWKKCSIPPSSRMNPNPLSINKRAIVPVGIRTSELEPWRPPVRPPPTLCSQLRAPRTSPVRTGAPARKVASLVRYLPEVNHLPRFSVCARVLVNPMLQGSLAPLDPPAFAPHPQGKQPASPALQPSPGQASWGVGRWSRSACRSPDTPGTVGAAKDRSVWDP